MRFLQSFFVRLSDGTNRSNSRRGSLGLVVAVICILPPVASAQVIISEIMYDVPGSDSKAEWIELYNTSTEPVDVSKWKLNDGSNHVLNAPPKNGSSGSLTVPAGGYLLLASDAATFRTAHTVGVSVIDTVMSLGNDADGITLFDEKGAAVDTVSYGKSAGGNGTGESLQKVGGVFAAAGPTPGITNTSERLPRKEAPVKAPAKKASSVVKNTAIPKEVSTSTDASSKEAQKERVLASAVVPAAEGGSAFAPWFYGALAIGVAGAGAVLVARQKKKGEWDIEEIA